MTVAGVTSTGSKRPDLLFGTGATGVPLQMMSASGCKVFGSDGREYLDFIMGLGAVALGYGDPEVDEAVVAAVRRGSIGPLPPIDETDLAADLHAIMPWLEQVRFLKSGAEATAAAVRLARASTGRDLVLGCGYHGWLDWCSNAAGVPEATRALYQSVPFNDPQRAVEMIRAAGDRLACVVVEPVIDGAPSLEWLTTLRSETTRSGAVLIFDEIKTAFRVALGGMTELLGVTPDLMVIGKAMANGFPLAAVGGRRELMATVDQTWISSTMATEFVSLAAARATIKAMTTRDVPRQLGITGARLLDGLHQLGAIHAGRGVHAAGIAQMCHLRYDDENMSRTVAAECARRGLLFKRTGYNFVSMAHDAAAVDVALGILAEVLTAC